MEHRSRRTPLLACTAIMALVGGACAGGGAQETTPTTGALRPVSTTVAPNVTAPPPSETEIRAAATTDPPTSGATASTVPASSGAGDPGDEGWEQIVADLLRIEFELPRDPAPGSEGTLCVEPSPCHDEWTQTIAFLTDNGVRLDGGAPFEVEQVEYVGTIDGRPIEEATIVEVTVVRAVTAQTPTRLVRGDGSVFADVPADLPADVGERFARTISLGRSTTESEWKLFQTEGGA